MAEKDVPADEPTLRQIFDAGWDAQRKIDSGKLTSNTDDFKSLVREGVSSLERATHLVNQLNLFSRNECIEELPTSDLRYLLLPALLGDLTLQLDGGERLDILHRARLYFVDYLQRCKNYSITEDDPPSRREPLDSSQGGRSFAQTAADRTAKIARLKTKKEMEKKIEELAERMKAASSDDDDLVREHLLSLLKYWVLKCQEGVASTDQEIQLLEGMGRMRDAPGDIARQRAARPAPPGQSARPPLVITRDMLKGKVFGAGYPSLPAMSVEQFFNQQYKQQLEKQKEEATPQQKSQVSDDEKNESDEESEEALKRAREFDEFKDSNRRGWGNKKNMG